VQELLNIVQFCHWKFNKMKTNLLGEIWVVLVYVEKASIHRILRR
jgi:hypothetical protein